MGLPANKKTEKKALNALEGIIDNSPIMDYSFNSADKEMAWDGYIWIFKNGDIESKKNYDDKIPVQIKGHIDTIEKYVNRNFLNLGIIESRNYIRISYGSFLYAGTNGISPFS